MHLPSLAVGLAVMIGGTVYPLVMTTPARRPDHGLAMLLFWAMCAGFIRGVGFVPRLRLWRWLFSGWASVTALAGAAAVRWAS